MRKLWLLALLLVGCGSIPSGESSDSKYDIYTNVSYYYNDDLTYVVELNDNKYDLDINNVYYVRKSYATIQNKFYVGKPNKLVIYIEMK